MALVSGRSWIYAADVLGPVRKARRILGYSLIAFYIVLPWIPVGGQPAVRIDIPARRLILLGSVFTPHDTWALALLGLIAALALFLFTSILGRVWCGWACPQTVWLDWVFRPIERLVEGKANARRKLDKQPWGPQKIARKALKWSLFAVVVVATTGAVMSWFVGGPELLRGEFGPAATGVWAFLAVTFFLDVAWFREQLCLFACPYARFQGALMDERSLVVAYDVDRGEPRGKARDPNAGDCVDCRRCVNVCPSGVDIRDGDQLQCIACGSCVDACDEIMVQLGRPKGLVRYTTERDKSGKVGVGRNLVRARTLVYGAILLALSVLLVVGLVQRSPVVMMVARPGLEELYKTLPGGLVANQFQVHVTNRSSEAHEFRVEARGVDGLSITVPGQPLKVAVGAEVRVPAFVTAPVAAFEDGRLPITITVLRDDGLETHKQMILMGPAGSLALARLPDGADR